MLLATNERFYLHCELNLKSYRSRGLPLEIIAAGDTLDAVSLWQQAMAKGEAKLELGPQDSLRLMVMQHDEKRGLLTLLFRRGDPRASAQIYENLITGVLRKSDKTDDDMVSVSCHLFIQTKAVAGSRYRAILEEVPGIGRSYVQRLLSDIIFKHRYTWKNEKGVEKESATSLNLDGVKSEKIDATDGTFDTLELVRTAKPQGLDEPMITPREETMKLKIKAGAVKVPAAIGRVVAWAKGNGWEDVRVRVRFPEGRSRVVTIGRDADAADVLFVRSELIKVKKPLDACSDNIVNELVEIAAVQFKAWK